VAKEIPSLPNKVDLVKNLKLCTDLTDLSKFKNKNLVEGWIKDLVRIEKSTEFSLWTENNFRKEWEVPHSFIFGVLLNASLAGIEERCELIAFLVWHKVLDQAHILNFAVETKYRGLGLGKLVVSEVCSDMLVRRVRWVHLECRERNFVAQKLYRSMGFDRVGFRPNFYDDTNEGALLFTKDLLDNPSNYHQ
jgi:ribosomal protein S18 acetylase RimI-like enzyme